MKISIIIPSFYPATVYGGPIFSTLNTCQELAKINYTEVRVSTTNTNMTSRLDVATGEWIEFSNGFFVKYYNETRVNKISFQLFFNVWKDIRDADVIHIQSIFNTPIPISLLFSQLFTKPVLLSPRGSLGSWCLQNGSRLKGAWLKFFIQPFANKIVWHATATQEKIEINAIFPDAKVEVIPNGVDYDLFQKSHPLLRKEYIKEYIKKEIDVEKIIVSMGRLQKKKGFDILINSFAEVLLKIPRARLFIAGQDEGEENNLRRQINNLKLEGKVFLLGSIEGQKKVDFLANADIFVLPSYNENFGNVYIESLASGTPIVASRNTPWKEVEEANCGKWVNNSVEETSNAIIQLLDKERGLMRVNCKRFAKKYDWKNIAFQFKDVFDGMANVND